MSIGSSLAQMSTLARYASTMSDIARTMDGGTSTASHRRRGGQAFTRLAGAVSVALLVAACTTTQLATEPPDLPLTEGDRVQPPAGNTIPTFVAAESAAPPDPDDAVPAPGVVGEPVPESSEPSEGQED